MVKTNWPKRPQIVNTSVKEDKYTLEVTNPYFRHRTVAVFVGCRGVYPLYAPIVRRQHYENTIEKLRNFNP
jgi:hypothetical protein